MKRDMELIRKILFKIEEEYVSTALFNLTIEGYEVYQAGNNVNGVVLGTTNIIKPVGQ